LHERGFQPWSAFSQAIGATFTSTLVALRAQTCPGDEMACRWETGHIGSDFGQEGYRTELTHTGNRFQEFDRVAKGVQFLTQMGIHLFVDRIDCGFDRVDLLEVEFEEEAVILRDATTQYGVRA
jgi:hypothetical protein